MSYPRVLAVLGLVTLFAERSWADEPAGDAAAPAHAQDLFATLDANGDGVVTGNEVGDEHDRLFRRLLARADRNDDGKLDADEFAAGLAEDRPERPSPEAPEVRGNPEKPRGERPEGDRPKPGELFKRADANGDGRVTEDEVPEERRPMFGRLLEAGDEDGDGALTREEFAAAFREVAPRGEGPRREGPPRQGPPEGPGEARPEMAAAGQRLLRALDTDGDGVLSSGELAAAAEGLKKLDADGDGSLSAPEIHGPLSRELAGGPPRPEMLIERIMQADEDGDGKLSEDECPPRLAQGFDRLDADGDGYLDKSELREGLAALDRVKKQADKKKKKKDGDKPRKKKPEETSA